MGVRLVCSLTLCPHWLMNIAFAMSVVRPLSLECVAKLFSRIPTRNIDSRMSQSAQYRMRDIGFSDSIVARWQRSKEFCNTIPVRLAVKADVPDRQLWANRRHGLYRFFFARSFAISRAWSMKNDCRSRGDNAGKIVKPKCRQKTLTPNALRVDRASALNRMLICGPGSRRQEYQGGPS